MSFPQHSGEAPAFPSGAAVPARGGRQEIQSDARVIAATNIDLKLAISENRFREDLYFRLAVVVIKLPPLRERGEDTSVLAREFLQRYAVQNGRTNMNFTAGALRALNTHSWSGNVRELQNRIKRAVIMADGTRITEADLELTDAGEAARVTTLKEAREAVEKELVEQTLRKHLGRVSSAAIALGISRPTLYELMEKFGIPKKSVAGSGDTDSEESIPAS